MGARERAGGRADGGSTRLDGGSWSHAVAAWLCGFPAFPGPWFTPIAEERSPLFALLITAGLAAFAWRGRVQGERALTLGAAVAWVAQIAGTVVLRAESARTLITFAGDAGSLVFGAALLAAFFVPPGHPLHRGWLRWGFLVIGAAAFVDTFGEWWVARREISAIAFGEIEGRGDTDPTKLLEAGWTAPQMVSRYIGLGLLSLAAMAALQVRHVRRTQAALEALNRPNRPRR